ncbi:hypothetical protein COHCIP112018_04563 [Cohnella sp. JJ-181]|nr:hypothetical protein COHCIP112018_04563 [Cohnella sp. JJ-181]
MRAGRISVITVILLSVGLINHVVIMPLLLEEAGRDAWISIVIAAVGLMFAFIPLCASLRAIGLRAFPVWLKEKSGRLSQIAVLAVVCAFLGLEAAATSVDMLTWTNGTYLPETPPLATSLIFVLLCAFSALIGMHSVIYISCIVFPAVSFLGVFVAVGNAHRKDYAQLLPVLEHGMSPVLQGTVTAASGMAELFVFVLLQGYATKPFRAIHVYATGLFIVMLATGPAVAAIAEFGVRESANMRFPAFSQWRLLTIGRYIEHLDFFAIFQWISGAFVRTTVSLCLILDLIGVRSLKKRAGALALFSVLLVILCVYPFGDDKQYAFYAAMRPVVLIAMAGLTLYVWALSLTKRGKGSSADANGA